MGAVVAIYGPTASGKSAIAVALAHAIDGEIVSADSMQVYRGLERITNQPTVDERQGIAHHLVGCVDPRTDYDVVRYAADAHAAIDAILARGRTPIVAGGSGLYLRAALAELAFPPQAATAERAQAEELVERIGAAAAHARLAELDPAAASRIDPADARRIVRALELADQGASLAPDGDDALWASTTRLPTRLFALEVDRALLRARIDARTPRLLDDGGIDEVAALLADPRPLSRTAAQAHGIDDIRALISDEIDRAECERRLAARTRQYAKRQDTWRRRLAGAETVAADDEPAAVAAAIAERLRTPPG